MLSILHTATTIIQASILAVIHFLTANSLRSLPALTMSESRAPQTHIVILGGSFSGVSTAHRILKLQAARKTRGVKITLVSPCSDFYWNLASPRGLLPGQISDDQLFQPIAAGFSGYPAGWLEFIEGRGVSFDVEAKQVGIVSAAGDEQKMLGYDFLILATGSTTKGDVPFKSMDSTAATKRAVHEVRERVKKAQTIVIAGAGATGVEMAGELGFEYKDKKIILISSGPVVLDGKPAFVSKYATKQLENLNVKIRFQTTVTGSTQLSDGRQELTLSSGDTLIADLYIPTFGVTPNSSYVPGQFLNANGFVLVDDFLKVKGAGDTVWAIGDVSAAEPPQLIYSDKQSVYVAKNINLLLSGKAPLPYKKATPMMGVQIGKKTGVGHYGSWRIPEFMINHFRKTLFVEKLRPTVDGSGL